MEDLLQSQIRDSCKLALPEGLKDLMADISREVLRAQPQNLYQFIADYLSTLLVAREHLFIAARVCDDVCNNSCCADLEEELRALSLNEEDVQGSLEIISKYFSSDEVKERNLLQKLIKKTGIDPKCLPAVKDAVRRAFLRHQLNKSAQIESPSTDSELDETTLAVNHTLRIYKQFTESPDINYDCVASRIQAAYRAYNVRRMRKASYKSHAKNTENANEKVRFQEKEGKPQQTEQLVADLIKSKRCASKCSSVSLAGSFLELPLYKPYSIGQPSDIKEVDEICAKETEHANFDYVTNELSNPRTIQLHKPETTQDKTEPENNKGNKTISFHNLALVVELDDNEVLDEAEEASYESEEVYEDMLNEQLADEENINDVAALLSNDDDDEVTTLETKVVSDFKGDESSESWIEDGVDDVQMDEIETQPENWKGDDVAPTEEDNLGEIDDDKDEHVDRTSADMLKDMEDVTGNPQLSTIAGNEHEVENLAVEDYENFLV